MDALVVVDDCPHPELTTWQLPWSHETHFACNQCQKHIILEDRTLITRSRDDLTQLLHMNFGGRWASYIMGTLMPTITQSF